MKHKNIAWITFTMLVLLAGCKSGGPTVMPTLAIPYTKVPEPTRTPVPTETPIPTETLLPTEIPIPTARVRRQATLRAGPGVEYPVAGQAKFNDSLIIYAQCEGWYQIDAEGNQWINEGRVVLDVDPAIIPDICSAP
jgi:hypothetical protein